MSTGLRVLLAVIAVGALLWLGFMWFAPSPIAPSSPIAPLMCFVMGVYFASTFLPVAAQARPGSGFAAANAVAPTTRLVVFGVGFALAFVYMVVK